MYESRGFSKAQLSAAAEEHNFHPAVVEALRWFVDDGHLPWNLAAINNSFGELAMNLAVAAPRQTQTTHCLHRLTEAKDCAVRAFIREEEEEEERLVIPVPEDVELPDTDAEVAPEEWPLWDEGADAVGD